MRERRAGGSRLSGTRVREAMRRAERLRRMGKLAEARAAYGQVLAARPDHRDALKSCAVVCFQLDDSARAAALLRRALVLDEQDAGAHNDLGNVLQAAGRITEAVREYRRAVEIDPARAEAYFNLGHALRAAGEPDAAAEAYGRVAALRPKSADAPLQIGLLHHAQGEPEEAARAFRRALAIDPGSAEARFALGNALYAQGRLDEAVASYEEAVRLRPDILDGTFEVGKPRHIHALLDRGDARAALDACARFLARRPGQSGALAMKAVAHWELGEHEEALGLLGLERLVRAETCAPPEGFESIGAFNAAFAAHLRAHPTLEDAPESYSMERGKSTGELFPGRDATTLGFRAMVADAVESYRKALPADPDHPFLASPPEDVEATAWGVILDAGAYQVPHIHPSAWVSGVYYVSLPPAVSAEGQAGWIEFGRPYWDFQMRTEPATRLVKPEEGLMLLFPSYLFHQTLPFEGAGERISVAFDILRAE